MVGGGYVTCVRSRTTFRAVIRHSDNSIRKTSHWQNNHHTCSYSEYALLNSVMEDAIAISFHHAKSMGINSFHHFKSMATDSYWSCPFPSYHLISVMGSRKHGWGQCIVYRSSGGKIGNSSRGHGVLPFGIGRTWFKLAVTSSNQFLPVVVHDKWTE